MKTLRTDKTGAVIEIRPLCHDDAKLLKSFYDSLSEETFHARFGYSLSKHYSITDDWIFPECDLDPKTHFQLIALHDGEIVGIGTLDNRDDSPCFSEGTYDVSHVISDEYQSRGIGSLLMEGLLSEASYRKKKTRLKMEIIAYTTIINWKAKALLKKFGFVLNRVDDGEMIWMYKVR